MTFVEMERNKCRAAIEENNRNIKKYEELYDSLKMFKTSVVDSHSYFLDTNAGKENKLSNLATSVINCRTVTEYCDGMSKVLNSVGKQVVGFTYSALLLSIEAKLTTYLAGIQLYEAENVTLQRMLAALDTKSMEEV